MAVSLSMPGTERLTFYFMKDGKRKVLHMDFGSNVTPLDIMAKLITLAAKVEKLQ